MAQQCSIFWITLLNWMTKYIIGEIFCSGGATLYKNHSDQTVYSVTSWLLEQHNRQRRNEAVEHRLVPAMNLKCKQITALKNLSKHRDNVLMNCKLT